MKTYFNLAGLLAFSALVAGAAAAGQGSLTEAAGRVRSAEANVLGEGAFSREGQEGSLPRRQRPRSRLRAPAGAKRTRPPSTRR